MIHIRIGIRIHSISGLDIFNFHVKSTISKSIAFFFKIVDYFSRWPLRIRVTVFCIVEPSLFKLCNQFYFHMRESRSFLIILHIVVLILSRNKIFEYFGFYSCFLIFYARNRLYIFHESTMYYFHMYTFPVNCLLFLKHSSLLLA